MELATSADRPSALSIIVPCLDEGDGIAATLERLRPLRKRGAEVIVVDGGSTDATAARAEPLSDVVLSAPRGRASQMNAGARHARAPVLLFLHADTALPGDADLLVLEGLKRSKRHWGRFDVTIHGRPAMLRVIAAGMNLRSRWTGIATGDQAIFVTRSAFDQVGGFPPIQLMEDIAFSSRLKRVGPPLCISQRATTSGRRWEKHGVLRTVLLMWRLRLAYHLGADPETLAARYVANR